MLLMTITGLQIKKSPYQVYFIKKSKKLLQTLSLQEYLFL